MCTPIDVGDNFGISGFPAVFILADKARCCFDIDDRWIVGIDLICFVVVVRLLVPVIVDLSFAFMVVQVHRIDRTPVADGAMLE